MNLNVLRVEGNYALNDPPPEVLRSGAGGVVRYFQDKVKNDEQGRILDIITSTQDCLQQVIQSNLNLSCLMWHGELTIFLCH